MRDKLIELLREAQYLGGLEEKVADHLIANGVTINPESLRPQWISVEDRLPTEKRKCLVYDKCHCIDVARFTPCYDGWEEHLQGKTIWYDFDSEYGDYEISGITHWMPLPEPPNCGADMR